MADTGERRFLVDSLEPGASGTIVVSADVARRAREIVNEVHQTAQRCGRDPDTVRLVAVSKRKSVEHIRAAYDAGLRDFGENYVQEALEKMDRLPGDIRWHMIGHLQSNKAKPAAEGFALVHTLDRSSVGKALNKAATARGIRLPVLLQVNMGGEATKSGSSVDEALELAVGLAAYLLLPLLLEAPLISRTQASYASFLASHAVSWRHLLTLLYPEAFGTPLDDSFAGTELWEEVAYFGLVPRVSQSAGHCHHGRITKAGPGNARSLAIEAAQMLARSPSPIATTFYRVRRKKGYNVAVTALARKLIVLVWYMLQNGEPYRYAPVESTRRKLRSLVPKQERPRALRPPRTVEEVYREAGLTLPAPPSKAERRAAANNRRTRTRLTRLQAKT